MARRTLVERPATWRAAVWTPAALLAVAAVSMAVVAPAPSYDPWSWLLWGRELTEGHLGTEEGPAFKPLPVAVCALLAPLGAAAPAAWVLVARIGAVAAVWLAFRLGRRLADGSFAAGGLAAVGVALCGGYLAYASAGQETGLLLALGLGAAEAWRAGRPRAALACGAGCALLRAEAWPFLLLAALLLWRRGRVDARWPAAVLVAVPAAWLLPELWASGDPLRSGARARVPNPGQPALADVPVAAALGEALALPLWPLWAGAVAAAVAVRRRAASPAVLAPAAAGLAWIALVAAMAGAGFSGEPRYSLPGATLVAVTGAAGLVWAARSVARRAALAPALAVVLVLGAAAPRLADLPALRSGQAYQARLAADLAEAVRAAGGRERVLACGAPIVGRLRGPLLAYRLNVAKRVVDFEPRAPGVIFSSRLTPEHPLEPRAAAPFVALARAGLWAVHARCRGPTLPVGLRVP